MKKNTFFISLTYLVYFFGILISDLMCHSSWCRVHDDDFFGQIFFLFLPLLPVFLFSLITYKMRDEVFQAWWRFARFFVPVIMLVTFLINSRSRSGGMGISGAIAGSFDMFIIGLFYAIFIITSLVKITLAYRKNT